MLSTPAQMKTSPAPIAIAPAAIWTDCIEEPQKRLTVAPADRLRQAGQQADQPRDVQPLLALGEGAAERSDPRYPRA